MTNIFNISISNQFINKNGICLVLRFQSDYYNCMSANIFLHLRLIEFL